MAEVRAQGYAVIDAFLAYCHASSQPAYVSMIRFAVSGKLPRRFSPLLLSLVTVSLTAKFQPCSRPLFDAC